MVCVTPGCDDSRLGMLQSGGTCSKDTRCWRPLRCTLAWACCSASALLSSARNDPPEAPGAQQREYGGCAGANVCDAHAGCCGSRRGRIGSGIIMKRRGRGRRMRSISSSIIVLQHEVLNPQQVVQAARHGRAQMLCRLLPIQVEIALEQRARDSVGGAGRVPVVHDAAVARAADHVIVQIGELGGKLGDVERGAVGIARVHARVELLG
jgi:hypothetical protein